MILESTKIVKSGQSLNREQMTEVVDAIMKGNCSDEQIEGLLEFSRRSCKKRRQIIFFPCLVSFVHLESQGT